ncbi:MULTISPECIES: hypothetical protein [unclassified Gilliamella]|uniref:hypothetical protein n=1 Tax=unclassified Gilliamella TaxID=2685620 RepID=UPI00130B3B24|nr:MULTISPECIES: hypothetical protein [unclassified Gilliamella]MWP48841.1 hypothetical protein [Gilliamella sp. Lep-s35]MWP68815.1 hypothetical protein [Gilliamella sp. Lep-s5]MWP77112.1 hypothetical protein [Gilliamella sp. Lep-s21]
MARQANKAKDEIELPAIDEQGINDAMNTLTKIQSEYSDKRDLVNQIIGEQRMAEALGKFSLTVSTFKLKIIKENKLYKSLSGKKTADGQQFSGTWEDFCQLIGKSRPQVDEDILNLNIFGEEALDGMSQIGIGYRELRQYRKLTEDQKTALIEVAKAGDKEALVELAEEFIAKNTKEKEQLKKENSNLQADYKALSKRNADVTKEKEELAIKLAQFEMKTVPLDERLVNVEKIVGDSLSDVKSKLENFRQLIENLEKLQFEIFENDPSYDPEQPYSLPDSFAVSVQMIHGGIGTIKKQAIAIEKELANKFTTELGLNLDEFEFIMAQR